MKIQSLLICSLSVACLSWGCGDDSSNHADDPSVPENTAELCADGQDNDNNGKADCDDDSCKVFIVCAPKTCEGDMPEGKKDCECVDGEWANCQDEVKTCEGAMPEGKKDCECVDGEWANCQDEDKSCEGDMPEGKKDCECIDGEWANCQDEDKTCEGDMPEGKKDCECIDGEWANCQDEVKTCEGDMPEGKKDCECIDGEWANCQDEDKTCKGDMPEGKKDCECIDGEWTNCQDDVEKVEICDNKADDDEDGKIDCDDEDCEEHENCKIIVPACEEGASSCEGKTRNYCDGGVLKMEECPFECVDGSCKSCNDIHGPDTCEEKDGIFVHTYCSDEGRKTEGCIYGCEGDHCIACIKGSKRCSEDGKSLETCTEADNKTQWVATPCTESCEDNRCTGCTTANTRTCKDGILEICDSSKKYSSETCEFGCKDATSCHTCNEGALSCDTDGKTILICKNDELTFHSQCTNACNNASCEDENGNHMKDEFDGNWKNARLCSSHSACAMTTGFCDPMVNNGTCMNKCQHDTQCIDGYVCRPDGRCAPKEFVTVWRTNTSNEKISFKLSAGSGCNVSVDWGDGVTDTISGTYCTNRDSTHTYANPGEYRVKLSGDVDGWRIGAYGAANLIRIESFGPAGFAKYAFNNAVNLKSISQTDIPDASKLTTMESMFSNDSQFNDAMIMRWDVSNVTSMKNTFANSNINQDLHKWDTANVTDMSGMFQNAKAFNGPIEYWETSKVTDMNHMFDGASKFNQKVDRWNVQNVTDMSYMFNNTIFNQSIGSWNVSNVKDMSYMFANNSVFSQNIGSWDVSKVTNMSHMFSGASKFNCNIFEWKIENVTDMSYMFYKASAFNGQVNLWNVVNVKDTQYMFAYAENFNQYLSNWKVDHVTNMKGMFEGAKKFSNNDSNMYQNVYGLDTWNVSKVTDMSHMFEGSAYNDTLSDWDVSNVTDMSRMFYNNKAFNQPLKNWKTKTANVKDMREMFYGATAFNQDVSTWTVASVQNMSRMFYNATSYNYTSNDWRPTYITNSKDCTRLSEMFYKTKLSCSEARSMISNWGLKGVCTANQLRGSTDCD